MNIFCFEWTYKSTIYSSRGYYHPVGIPIPIQYILPTSTLDTLTT